MHYTTMTTASESRPPHLKWTMMSRVHGDDNDDEIEELLDCRYD